MSHLLHIKVFTAIIVQYDWIFLPSTFNILDCEHNNFWIHQLASRFSILYFYNETDPNESQKVPWPNSLHLLGSNSCLFGCYDVNLPRRHFQKALRNVFRLVWYFNKSRGNILARHQSDKQRCYALLHRGIFKWYYAEFLSVIIKQKFHSIPSGII